MVGLGIAESIGDSFMKLICDRTGVRDVARRWDEQYKHYDSDAKVASGKTFSAISKELHALDPESATADDVAKIIGNRTWAGVYWCDECKGQVKVAMQVGAEPDYESATATVCGPCLRKALETLDAYKTATGSAEY